MDQELHGYPPKDWTSLSQIFLQHGCRAGRDNQSKFTFFNKLAKIWPNQRPVSYLEVGSFQGESIACMSTAFRGVASVARICSIDPYYEEGYFETSPSRLTIRKNTSTATIELARSIYRACGIEVELRREDSFTGLTRMLHEGDRFDIIFIDGCHEKHFPMVDTSLALLLLNQESILCIDDTTWPDIRPVKMVLEQSFERAAIERSREAFWNRPVRNVTDLMADAFARQEAGDGMGAIVLMRKAVEALPRNVGNRISLAAALADARHFDEARATLRAGMALSSGNPDLTAALKSLPEQDSITPD